MGIPHLITYLQPYTANSSLTHRDVIIDGPGLAHHVYRVCTSFHPHYKSPLEAQPPYSLLVDTTVAWLDQLRKDDVSMYLCPKLELPLTCRSLKIYFDGYLPQSKRGTRFRRLANSSSQLTSCYKKLPTTPVANRRWVMPSAEKLFSGSPPPLIAARLPPAPFLVAAVIEGLLSSETYKPLVEMVPGEADTYCGALARQTTGPVTIITSDSDLLVQDLGSGGSVCLFQNIEYVAASGSLSASLFHPHEIAQRLGLPDPHGLRSLAFEMVLDSHGTFPQLLKRAASLNAVTVYDQKFADFVKEYIHQEMRKDPETTLILSHLDPRVAELVLQVLGNPDAVESASQIQEMFLPFVVDCPTRSSAWETSTDIRAVAYTILRLANPKHDSVRAVNEHRRAGPPGQRGRASTGKPVEVLSESDLPEASSRIIDLITKAKEQTLGENVWIVIALAQELQWSWDNGRESLTHRLRAGIRSKTQTPIPWETLHLFAQLLCSFYSFRMLRQFFVVLESLKVELPPAATNLWDEVDFLPPLAECPSITQLVEQMMSSDGLQLLAAARAIIGLPDEEWEEPRKKQKTREKSAERPSRTSSNPFDALLEQ